MAIYNSVPTIGQAVESFLAHNLPDKELRVSENFVIGISVLRDGVESQSQSLYEGISRRFAIQ